MTPHLALPRASRATTVAAIATAAMLSAFSAATHVHALAPLVSIPLHHAFGHAAGPIVATASIAAGASAIVAGFGPSPTSAPAPKGATNMATPIPATSGFTWKEVTGPLADAAEAYFVANEPQITSLIQQGEGDLTKLLAQSIASVIARSNPLLKMVEQPIAAALEAEAGSLIAQYGPSVVTAFLAKQVAYAVVDLGG